MFSRVIQRLGGKVPLSTASYCTAAPQTMEKTLNQVTLLGRAGMEPQRRGTTEHPVVVFSLATHFTYKQGNGEMMQKTEWHRVSVFRPYLREKVENFLVKGQRILVTGRVSYGEYKDDNDVMRSATTIIADDVIFFTPSNNRK